jgi:hypothetical protein
MPGGHKSVNAVQGNKSIIEAISRAHKKQKLQAKCL